LTVIRCIDGEVLPPFLPLSPFFPPLIIADLIKTKELLF